MPHSWRLGKLQSLEHELVKLYKQVMIWKRQTESNNNEQLKALTSKLDELTFMVVKLSHLEMQALDSDDSSESMICHRKKTAQKIFLTHEATQTSQQPLGTPKKVLYEPIEEALILSEATQTSQQPLRDDLRSSEESNSERSRTISDKLCLKISEVNERLTKLLDSSSALDDQIQRDILSLSSNDVTNACERTVGPIRETPSRFERLDTSSVGSSSRNSQEACCDDSEFDDVIKYQSQSKIDTEPCEHKESSLKPVIRILSKPRIISSDSSNHSTCNDADQCNSVGQSSSSLENPETPVKRKKRTKRKNRGTLPDIKEQDSSDSFQSQQKITPDRLRESSSSFQQQLPLITSSRSHSASSLSSEDGSGNTTHVETDDCQITPSFQQPPPESNEIKSIMKPSSEARLQQEELTQRLVLTAITFLILSLGTFVVWYA